MDGNGPSGSWGLLRCAAGLFLVLLAVALCQAKPDQADYTYVPGPLYILQIAGDPSTWSRVAYWDDWFEEWHYEYPDEEGYHHSNGQPWAVELWGGAYWKVEQDTGQGWQRVAAYNRCVVDLDSLTVDSELPGTQYDHNIPLNATGGTGAYTEQKAKVTVTTTPDDDDVSVLLDLGGTTVATFGGQATTAIKEGQTKYLTGVGKGTYTITPKSSNGYAWQNREEAGEVFEFEIVLSPDPIAWSTGGSGPEGYFWDQVIRDHTGYLGWGGTGWCGANIQISAYRTHTTATKLTYKLIARNGDTVCYAG